MNSSGPPSAQPRRHQRTSVSIEVTIVGVLESFDATIADLSEGGALITGASLPARARCEIHYADQILYGFVMWSEIDRIGVRFPYELRDGPLHQLLTVALSHPASRALGELARGLGGFGRRGL